MDILYLWVQDKVPADLGEVDRDGAEAAAVLLQAARGTAPLYSTLYRQRKYGNDELSVLHSCERNAPIGKFVPCTCIKVDSSIAKKYPANEKKNILSALLFMAPMEVYVTPYSHEMHAPICKYLLCTYMEVGLIRLLPRITDLDKVEQKKLSVPHAPICKNS